MISFKLVMFNIKNELKLKDVNRKVVRKRIEEENIEKSVSINSISSRKTV